MPPVCNFGFGLVMALCAALAAPPAAAQWVAVGRWAQGSDFRFVAPGTWMVLQEDGAVSISAEGGNHVGRLTFHCGADDPAGRLWFDLYYGDALARTPAPLPWPSGERVTLVIDNQPFALEVDYHPDDRAWSAEAPLTRRFLDAFAWSQRLDILNRAGEVVTSYGMTNSGAAREAVWRRCGL